MKLATVLNELFLLGLIVAAAFVGMASPAQTASSAPNFVSFQSTSLGACAVTGTTALASPLALSITPSTSNIQIWITVSLANNVTSQTGIAVNVYENASSIVPVCGAAPTSGGAVQIAGENTFATPTANLQWVVGFSFRWTGAVAGTTYELYVGFNGGAAASKTSLVFHIVSAVKSSIQAWNV